MKIIQLSDIHGQYNHFNTIKNPLEQADLILLSGDITHFGHYEEVDNIIQILMRYNKNILAVTGNCDYPEVYDYLKEKNMLLENTLIYKDSYSFMGMGGSLPCPFPTPNEYSEEEYNQTFEKMMKKYVFTKNLFFVAHQPPYKTLTDKLHTGEFVGSKSCRQFIEQYQPLAYLCGHIHESCNTDKLGKTHIINPGPWRDGRYALISLKNYKVSVSLKTNKPRWWPKQKSPVS